MDSTLYKVDNVSRATTPKKNLVSNGILCHYGEFSNDTSYE